MAGTKGCSGRPRKVVAISTGKISKQERLQRQKQEQTIKIDRDGLEEAPEWLSETAKKEYLRVVHEAAKVPFLDNLDRQYLAMYADAVDKYILAAEKLHKFGDVIKTDAGLTVSPYLTVQKKAEETIFKCSARLGLATTDRLRLVVPQVEEKAENKYLKFLKA